MKKVVAACVVVMMIFSQISVGAVNVILNSSFLPFPDQEPVIENGTTLVPIRPVAEALGLTVAWDEPTRLVTLSKDNFFIEMTIDKTEVNTSSGVKTLDVPPRIINSRTMVPLRFISEQLGLKVLWNDEYKRVVINGKLDITAPELKPTESQEVDDKESTTQVTQEKAEVVEEETEPEEEAVVVTVSAPSTTITFELPSTFMPEDPDAETAFAFKSVDATDIQHTYNWDIASQYESFADNELKNGIIVVVQDFEPYEGEDIDATRINEDYPTAPEFDYRAIQEEAKFLIMSEVFGAYDKEIPDGYEAMSDEELAQSLGVESAEEYKEIVQSYTEGFDMMQIDMYAEYMNYREEYNTLSNIKTVAFSQYYKYKDAVSDEEWAKFFSSRLNSDSEVRYEGIEVREINSHKIFHGTIYAEDPDDEQGTYDYYLYFDGDTRITIYGGTLNETEPSPEAVTMLGEMNIQ